MAGSPDSFRHQLKTKRFQTKVDLGIDQRPGMNSKHAHVFLHLRRRAQYGSTTRLAPKATFETSQDGSLVL